MRGKRAARLIGAALVAAAVAQELRKPSSERTWHGRLAGFVPYDFRPPTVERFKAAWWNPSDPRIFTDRVFGVGWSVNLGRVVKMTREAVA
ncbi:MAG TPA: DUF5808 domain-containing protein [Gaiellaceae bacterium]|nr:DUF5808 domain-containing protein [Gaiellaceae bacterium]